ncbi:MAG: hypothetical protein ACI9ZX_003149, partial [Algoriphagus sp.]
KLFKIVIETALFSCEAGLLALKPKRTSFIKF